MTPSPFQLSIKYIILIKIICVCIIIKINLNKIFTFNFIYSGKKNIEFIINKIYTIKEMLWFVTPVVSILSYFNK